MTPEQKSEILSAVERSPVPTKEALLRLDLPSSTYYRWKTASEIQGIEGLRDRSSYKDVESSFSRRRNKILEVARLYPDWSPREVSCAIWDNHGFTVSEPSAYRILKRSGLVKPRVRRTFPAGPEFRVKTKRINEMWQTDASYLLVKN